jgi:hypothetical protein
MTLLKIDLKGTALKMETMFCIDMAKPDFLHFLNANGLCSAATIPKSVRVLSLDNCGCCDEIIGNDMYNPPLYKLEELHMGGSTCITKDKRFHVLTMVGLRRCVINYKFRMYLSLVSRASYYHVNTFKKIDFGVTIAKGKESIIMYNCPNNCFPAYELRKMQTIDERMKEVMEDLLTNRLCNDAEETVNDVTRHIPFPVHTLNLSYLFQNICPSLHDNLEKILSEKGLHPIYLITNFEMIILMGLMEQILSERTIKLFSQALRELNGQRSPSVVLYVLIKYLYPKKSDWKSYLIDPRTTLPFCFYHLILCITAREWYLPSEIYTEIVKYY